MKIGWASAVMVVLLAQACPVTAKDGPTTARAWRSDLCDGADDIEILMTIRRADPSTVICEELDWIENCRAERAPAEIFRCGTGGSLRFSEVVNVRGEGVWFQSRNPYFGLLQGEMGRILTDVGFEPLSADDLVWAHRFVVRHFIEGRRFDLRFEWTPGLGGGCPQALRILDREGSWHAYGDVIDCAPGPAPEPFESGQIVDPASLSDSDSLCFRPVPLVPGPPLHAGQVVVAWFQPDDDGPDPPVHIGWVSPFDPTVAEIRIPLADVLPPNEPNLLCERSCDDEARCACEPGPSIGFGVVGVLPESFEVRRGGDVDLVRTWERTYGLAWMALVYSEAGVPVPDGFFRELFEGAAESGIRAYAIEATTLSSMRYRLALAPPDECFALNVCPRARGDCELPLP